MGKPHSCRAPDSPLEASLTGGRSLHDSWRELSAAIRIEWGLCIARVPFMLPPLLLVAMRCSYE